MEKDGIEKNILFKNQNNDIKDNNLTEIKLAPSLYKIKNNDNYELNFNDEEGDNKHLVKKVLHNSDDKNTIINNDNKSVIKDKLKKSISQNNLVSISRDIKKNKKNKIVNNRYQCFENEDISDKYDDEFSLNKNPKEKPNFQKNKNDLNNENEEMNQISEIRKIMMRSSNQNIKASYLQEEEDNMQTEKAITKNVNDDRLKDINFTKIYAPYKKIIEKTNFFIFFFSIGIVLSIITASICIYLRLYGNEDVYFILAAISFIIIGIYIFGIKIISKYKENILIIISMRKDPERIIQSKQRKYLHLFIYLLLLAANYYYVILFINTSFLNNIKLSIRGKGYDIKQWVEYFSNKNYIEILTLFEKINISFLVFGWLNWLLMIFILIYKIILICNYRVIKSITQVLCIFSIQAGIFLIYLSIYCYKFKDASSFEVKKISWATPGTLSNGCIAIILGFFGFYAFFMENKKKIVIYELICFAQIILLLIFSAGLYTIEDKFYNYKKATCNSLFKYISEDYILKNKITGCSSKYLFNSETIDNIECPKDRIMINWEVTESYNENQNTNDVYSNVNKTNLNKDNKISFGCINQSCCLQIYFMIKNKFDFLLMLSIHQITYFLFIFILGIYLYKKISSNLEEEFTENINIIIMFVLTFFILIIILPFILNLPKESNQSILNKIKNIEAQEDSSIIPRDLIQISKQNLWKYTFKSIKQKEENNLKYNIIIENNNEYKLSYYEYSIISFDSDIIVDKQKLEKIKIYDYQNNTYINSTKIIKFKSSTNIINNIFEYFDLIPYYPLKENILLNIEINGVFVIKENEEIDYHNNINNNYNKFINITKEKIKSNYDDLKQNSIVNILKEKLDFSIMNKEEFFYIVGKINNDDGRALINVYNYYYSNDPIYSIRTNNSGHFKIGPIYKILNSQSIYYLNIEASKINEIFEYCKYYDIIKINEYGFHSNKYYPLNNIYLPLSSAGSMTIKGVVKKYEKEQEPIKDVNIRLFYGEKINQVNEYIEDNQKNINLNYLESECIERTSTNKDGEYNLNINKNGQFMIIFMKDEYYLEKHIFIIKDISSSGTLDMGTMYLVNLFNSGKLVVKLEWDYKPPDLDLICRFQVKKNHYCYTFFGNKKCVKTEYFQDSREANEISSEIIEINEFSEYLYFFYVRKYFDISNGKTKNEKKKDGVEIGPYINYTDIDIKYNEYLNNTAARLLIYTNGFRVPAIKINIPGFENTESQSNNQTEYNYWGAFCINGKEGISSLKVVNKLFQNEIPKDICLSYYDKSKLTSFSD